MLAPDDLQAFLRIVGPEGLLTADVDLQPYEMAARYGAGKAAAVVRPADTAQVSAVLRHCVARRIAYTPQSGNTGLVQGGTPDRSGRQLIISLDRLRSAPIVDAFDRTVQVSAGTRLSALNAALEPHGLFLPIDVSSDPMIGGMVATNTGGARYLRYGDMRRHVLGLEVVLPDADGTVLSTSRGLRKDNAQLDLRQLFVGSGGGFGIVTAATLEVQRRPRQSATLLLVPRDDDAVMELLAAFEAEAGEYLTAFEGMSEAVMNHALTRIPSLSNPFPDGLPRYAILVELSSTTAERTADQSLNALLMQILTDLSERPSAPLADVRLGAAEALWALRHALSEGLRATGPVIGFDLSFRRSAVMAFRRVAMARLAVEFPQFEVCDFGHVADGGVHFNVVRRPGFEGADSFVEGLRDRVLELAIGDFGASFSGEHGIGRANQADYDKFTPASIQRYSAAIAAVFARMPAAAVRFGPPPIPGDRDDH